MTDYSFPTELIGEGRASRIASDARHKDSALHYQFILPANWHQVTCEARRPRRATEFVDLCSFASPQRTSAMNISFLKLPRECGASEWSAIDQQLRSHKVLQRRDLYSKAGSIPDTLSGYSDLGVSRLCRSTVIKDGSQLIRLECHADEADYSGGLDQDFCNAVMSFEQLHPQKEPYAEKLVTQSIRPGFAVQLPASWEMTGENFTIGNQQTASSFVLREFETSFDGTRTGTICIAQVQSKQESETILRQAYQHYLTQKGISGSRVDLEEVDVGDSRFLRGLLYSPQGSDFQAPFLTLESDFDCFLVSLIAPRSVGSEWEAINKRAFEIARDSIVMQDEVLQP